MKKSLLIFVLVFTVVLASACGAEQTSDRTQESAPAAAEAESIPEPQTSDPEESVPEPQTPDPEESVPEPQQSAPEETPAGESGAGEDADPQAVLGELAALLGMQDEQTAGLFGGGEENWTEDGSFYIGRMYEIEMGQTVYPVFTSCDEDGKVNSVSVWLSDGERSVERKEAEQWAQILTEFTGMQPVYDETTSEAGSISWKWIAEDKIITLHWLDTVFTISMNPAVGELK